MLGLQATREHVGLDPPLRFKALPAISLILQERVVGVGSQHSSGESASPEVGMRVGE